MYRTGRFALGAGLLASVALAACSEDAPIPEQVGVSVAKVVGGEMIEACQWPSTVHVNSCTATLIHPRVVTTAAHCLSGARGTVTFGNSRTSAGAFTLMGECHAGARGAAGGGTRNDWGYCVIPEDERVKAIPYTPPLVGCEAEKVLKVGATAWVVGWGATNAAGAGYGVKRQVAVKVNRLPEGIVDVGDRDHGACHGDSGGPIYMQVGDEMHDWGWRTVGSTSSAGSANCDCTCNTIYVNISMHVAAIERDEGIDVTPCTDANGDWDPSEDCKDFASAPQMGSGTYPSCTVPLSKMPIETCGVNPHLPTSAGGTGGGGPAGSGGSGGSAGVGGSSGMGGASGAGAGGSGGSGGSMMAAAGMGGAGGSTIGTAGTIAPIAGGGGAGGMGVGVGLPGAAGAIGTAGGAGGIGVTSMGVNGGGIGGSAGFPAPAGASSLPSSQDDDSGCSALRIGSRQSSHGLGLCALALLVLARSRRRSPAGSFR